MKLGLDSYSYHLAFGKHGDFRPSVQMTLENFMERVKELGLDGFQIDPCHFESLEEDYLKEIRRKAKGLNLYVEAGACGTDPAELDRMLKTANLLGSKVLRTFIGIDRYAKKNPAEKQIKAAIENLLRVVRTERDYAVIIAVENHQDITSEEILQVIKGAGPQHVRICLDTGNFIAVLEDTAKAVKRLAPYVSTVHLKDYEILQTNYGVKVRGAALGKGALNLPEIVGILRENAPQINLNIEVPVEAGQDERETLAREDAMIRESVRYAREVLRL